MLCLCTIFQLKLFSQCFIHASKDHLILTTNFSESNYSLPAHSLRKK